MVTCSVCGTEFQDNRPECPCCGKPPPRVITPVPAQRVNVPPPPRIATSPVPIPPLQAAPTPKLPQPPASPPAPLPIPAQRVAPVDPPPVALPPARPVATPPPPLRGTAPVPAPAPAPRRQDDPDTSLGGLPTFHAEPKPAEKKPAPEPWPIPVNPPPVAPVRDPAIGAGPTFHGERKVELPAKVQELVPSRFRALLPSFTRWDFAALAGGGLGATLWYLWSRMDVRDPITPQIILALPIFLILFRKPLDVLLAPLEVVKSRIPRLFLIGVGLATPYLVTNYFYTKLFISNFPLARQSIIWGTLISYVIMRVPETDGLPKLSSFFRGKTAVVLPWFCFAVAFFTLTDFAWADDFGRDWRRLEDGMRTPGWAQTIVGTTATIINGLVNGALIFQNTIRRPRQEGEAEDDTRYTLDVRTEDQRTKLAADGEDRLWVYGQLTCDKPKIDTASLTRALAFQFSGDQAGWMSIKTEQFNNGFKSVQIVCTPPTPETEVPEDAAVTVTVSGRTAEGDTVEVPVQIRLGSGLKMEVEILS